MNFNAAPLSSSFAAEGEGQSIGTMRHRDFLAACRRVVRNHPHGEQPMKVSEIAGEAAKGPAPQYYVSFDYALRMVYRINSRGTTGVRGPMERCWQEIAARVRDLKEKSHGRLSTTDALARVLATGNASSFFLTPAAARRLYHHARRSRRPLQK